MSAPADKPAPLPQRRWTVCLLHHAHTDLGYNDLQCRIARRHAQFIDQALDIVRRAKAGDAGLRDFVWTSECFWSIEQWLHTTPAARHVELADAIRGGSFGLSGTYLHFTELVDDYVLRQMLSRGADYARALGVPLNTAVSADINGFSWGYAHLPWDLSCKAIHAGKCAHAAAASERTTDTLDSAFTAMGETPMACGRPFLYKAVNPLPTAVRDVARLYLESCDFNIRDVAATVVDVATGRVLPHQQAPAPRGITFDVRLDLAPGETALLELREGRPTLAHIARHSCDAVGLIGGPGDVIGAEAPPALTVSPQTLESPFVRIAFAAERGIVSWLDRQAGCELMVGGMDHTPFMPVYDLTPVSPKHDDTPHMMASATILTRSRMGRNRKGADARHFAGRLESVKVVERGPQRATVQLDYAIEGCTLFRVLLSAWADLPRVDASVRLNKQSVWEPENLYLALPFTSGGEAVPVLWLDKAGAPVRPWRDQLPDSLTDFYCVQDGVVFLGCDRGLALATPDAPLLQLGELTHGPRHLMGSPHLPGRPLRPYSWLMTNYWETNFEASLGGFHEFNYRLEWGPHITTPAQGVDLCRALNHGIGNFRTSVPP